MIMQLLATAEEMQDVDRAAIRGIGIPGLLLMENAGRAFVEELENRIGSLASKHVAIVCGKGNNGGDGFVIARHLLNKGSSVSVLLLCKRREVSGDAATNLGILLKMLKSEGRRSSLREMKSARQFTGERRPDVIVDAIFGTGFSGSVRGLQERAIRWVNRQESFVASVDIPSGVNATTGIVENVAVKADLTVTMGLAKIGHYVGSGRECSGEVNVVDISIPRHLYTRGKGRVNRVLADDVAKALPRRPLIAHKHSVGKIFVLAGSRTLTGAPFMASQSAMRSGAGAVILGVPASIHGVLARKVTEVMVTPLEETQDGTVSLSAWETIRLRTDWADVVVIGPGLSQNPETEEVVLRLLSTVEKPVVLDADGLTMAASDLSSLKKRKHMTILTPHVGELRRLTGVDSDYIELHRVDVALKAARLLRSIVVLKGAPTITGTPDGHTFVNSTGNPGMATAGSGDVLTGLIASLLGQGMSGASAAFSGVFIHGMAGDMSAKKYGQRGMMAMDILQNIQYVFKSLD
jgi:ADP-dependent NAD(P)H-hydrate dehydratase / NAD(P)H-hydrate epimerase